MNHNLLTSKITKKEKLCQNIGPYAWQFCFFKMTLLSWFQVPGGFFFACQKPSKALYLEMNFEMKLWLFFTNKKNWWIFLQLFRVSRYKTIQTSKKKTLKKTNLLTLSWLRFLGWSKNAMNLFLFITTTTNRLLINNQKVKISRNSNFH